MRKTKRVIEFLSGIDWAFGLNPYMKKILVIDDDVKNEKGLISAEVEFRENYQDMVIKLFPDFFKSSLEEQRRTLLHELCHSITQNSKNAMLDLKNSKLVTPERINEINETETSKIENLLCALLEGRLNYAKRAYKEYLDKPTKTTKPTKKHK